MRAPEPAMTTRATSNSTPTLGQSARAAGESALETAPFLIVAGLVAFAPMGPAMVGLGIAAAFAAAVLVQLCLLAVSRGRGPIVGGPSLGLALILAGALQALLDRGLLAAGTPGPALAVTMSLTLLCGLLLAAVAALRLGSLAAIVPRPVLAGLRNGTALLLLLEQADAVLGLPHGSHFHGDIRPGAAVVAAVTVAAMLVRVPGLRDVPPVLRGLALGTAAHHLLALVPGGAGIVGPVMAAPLPAAADLAAGWQAVPGLAALPGAALGQVLLPTLASMALLALLETVAARSALNVGAGGRGGAQRDLLGVTLANLVGGSAGALPASGILDETVATAHAAQRRAPRALLLRAAALAGLGALLLPVLGQIPGAVLAGVIVVAALEVFDLAGVRRIAEVARRGRAHRIEGLGNVVIVAAVAVAALAANLAMAVLLGALLALLVFAADMARGPVRRRYRSPIGRSRTRRDERASEALLQEGGAIEVIELQGALFFASADIVAAAMEGAVAAGVRHVVLDLRHVHRMDLSGAEGLIAACDRVGHAGHRVSLSGLHRGAPAWDYLHDRALLARLPEGRVFATLEDALEAAEDALLEENGLPPVTAALTPEAALAALDIPPAAVPGLLARMSEVAFADGATILQAGETSRTMFILLEGRADVMLPMGEGARAPADWRVRVATLAPGTMFGEMALLTGRPRSADMVANGPVRCLRLDPGALEALRAEAPEAAWQLLRAVAVQIELNLRLANAAIASYEA